MKYTPNTTSIKYNTLGSQVDYYSSRGKIMLTQWYGKNVMVGRYYRDISKPTPDVCVAYLGRSLDVHRLREPDSKPLPQEEISGFVIVDDNVDL